MAGAANEKSHAIARVADGGVSYLSGRDSEVIGRRRGLAEMKSPSHNAGECAAGWGYGNPTTTGYIGCAVWWTEAKTA
jgi:hypothetical protein